MTMRSSAPASTVDAVDWPVRAALWLARIALYVGLFFGIGGLFAIRWLIPDGSDSLRIVKAALVLGLVATTLSVGLQGLDALGAPLSGRLVTIFVSWRLK